MWNFKVETRKVWSKGKDVERKKIEICFANGIWPYPPILYFSFLNSSHYLPIDDI